MALLVGCTEEFVASGGATATGTVGASVSGSNSSVGSSSETQASTAEATTTAIGSSQLSTSATSGTGGGAPNLLFNGGFELECGSTWTPAAATLTTETMTVRSGSRACLVCADGTATTFSIRPAQAGPEYVPIVPGATYSGEAYVHSAGSGPVKVSLGLFSPTTVPVSGGVVTTASEWQPILVIGQPDVDATMVSLWVSNSGAAELGQCFLLDDMKLSILE